MYSFISESNLSICTILLRLLEQSFLIIFAQVLLGQFLSQFRLWQKDYLLPFSHAEAEREKNDFLIYTFLQPVFLLKSRI